MIGTFAHFGAEDCNEQPRRDKENGMKKSALIMALMLSGSAAMATLFTDDFNRGDTAYSTDESNIGANWVAGAADAQSAIKGNTLAYEPKTVANNVFYNTTLDMTSGGAGDSWSMSFDVTLRGAGTWGGIAFNVQDANNYYGIRFKAGDTSGGLVRVVNGSIANVKALTASATVTAGVAWTFSVSSTDAYAFTYSVTSLDGLTTLVSGSATDALNNFDGGGGGIYYNHALSSQLPDVYADNFSVEVIPEPATFGLLGLSALGLLATRRLRI